jgi:hypothetical protein
MVVPEPRKRPRSSYKRFTYPNPNAMWQLDGTEWRLDDEQRTKQVICQVEDDCSRMVLAWAVDATENGEAAVKVVSDAIRAHGVPVRFLTDNSLAFNQSRRKGDGAAPLERYLKAFGVKPISGQVAKPTTQGKNERLHQTLQRFLEAHRPITTPERLTELLAEFADGYNHDRPHQELDGNTTPAEAYAQPDLFEASGTDAARPAGPARRRPYGAYDLGGLVMVDREVGRDGRVSAAHCQIYVGQARSGQTLRLSVTDDHLELFGPDGDALGVVTRPAPGGPRARINLFSDGVYYG